MSKITDYFSKTTGSKDNDNELCLYIDNPAEECIQDINLHVRIFPKFIQPGNLYSHLINVIGFNTYKWTHSIALDKRCQGGRISIIFQYYE
jgi:hypothetical protein